MEETSKESSVAPQTVREILETLLDTVERPEVGTITERKTFRLQRGRGFSRARIKVLDHPFGPVLGGPVAHSPLATLGPIGWVSGGLPAPFRDDAYLVEFVSADEVRILAYMDGFGRVFTAVEPVEAPPARPAAVEFERTDEGPEGGDVTGIVWVRDVAFDPQADLRPVARFTRINRRYRIFDGWYDFSSVLDSDTYFDALARAYLAFVFRAAVLDAPVPSLGLDTLWNLLSVSHALRGLRAALLMIDRAESDPALRVPALVRLFGRWLHEAGFTDETSRLLLRGVTDEETGPVRLVRTRRYANTYYLSREEGSEGIGEQFLWQVEAALNRLLLVSEQLGEEAARADEAQCLACDAAIRQSFAVQLLGSEAKEAFFSEEEGEAQEAREALEEIQALWNRGAAPDRAAHQEALEAGSEVDGEWRLRVALGSTMENLRLPFRFQGVFQVDVQAPGVAAFDLVVPNAAMMAAFEEDASAPEPGQNEAFRYGLQLAIALADAAFEANPGIASVTVKATPLATASEPVGTLGDESDTDDGWIEALLTEPADEDPTPLFAVTFERSLFMAGCVPAALTDPGELFNACQGKVGDKAAEVGAFDLLEARPVTRLRTMAPEVEDAPLDWLQRAALGAHSSRDLRVDYDAVVQEAARTLAQTLSTVTTTQEAIPLIREVEESADNPLVYQGCTRLMTALTQGEADIADPASIERAFVGVDPLEEALERARLVAGEDPQRAADILAEAIDESERSGRFLDTGEAVHRMFDSYVGRLQYNLVYGRDGRKVELLPPSLIIDYLDVVDLLDDSFHRSEVAVAYGVRCTQMAPTFPTAYLRCARVYMLVGDLDNAARLLLACLSFAVSPDEIAQAYYQLAYVEWKAGRPREGLACYCKSIMTSMAFAGQSSIELHELMRENNLDPPRPDQVNSILEAVGIPVAPVAERLSEVQGALRAAVDANLFGPARAFLITLLRVQPDDALVNVLRSLEQVLKATAQDRQ